MMADKLAELKAALEGMSLDALKVVQAFAEFLAKQEAEKKRQAETPRED